MSSFQELQERTNRQVDWEKSNLVLTQNVGDFDLFRLPDQGLGSGLFCSEKLREIIEKEDFTGLLFKDVENLSVSNFQKKRQMASPPPVFEIDFGIDWLADWRKNQPHPECADSEKGAASWHQSLIEQTQLDTENLEETLQRLTRTALVAPQWKNFKRLTNAEIIANPAQSRFFGRPFLPQNFEWPHISKDCSLAFLAQINLATLPQNADLPTKGMLFFFIDIYGSTNDCPTEAEHYRVFYFEETEGFVLTDFPKNMLLNGDFEPLSLDFEPFFDLPDNRFSELFDTDEWSDSETYNDFLSEISEEHGFFAEGVKLLGWSRSVQGPVELDAEIINEYNYDWSVYQSKKSEILPAARTWRLLFEFEAHEIGLSNQLGDPAICFLIREKDLMQRNFSTVSLVAQAT